MGIDTTGQVFFGQEFDAGFGGVFGSDIHVTEDLTDGLEHTVTITRDTDGHWATYVDGDTPYLTATNTTAYRSARATLMFDDGIDTCHWTKGTVDAVRVWNGGDYLLPSALDNDDAFFAFVATPGY